MGIYVRWDRANSEFFPEGDSAYVDDKDVLVVVDKESHVLGSFKTWVYVREKFV